MDPLEALDIREIYYLWQLAGGSADPAQAELRRHGLVVNMPAVLNLPVSALISSQSATGLRKDKGAVFDPSKIVLDLQNIRECLTQSVARDKPAITGKALPSLIVKSNYIKSLNSSFSAM